MSGCRQPSPVWTSRGVGPAESAAPRRRGGDLREREQARERHVLDVGERFERCLTLKAEDSLRAFLDKGLLRGVLERIPVRVILDEWVTLLCAGVLGRQQPN